MASATEAVLQMSEENQFSFRMFSEQFGKLKICFITLVCSVIIVLKPLYCIINLIYSVRQYENYH